MLNAFNKIGEKLSHLLGDHDIGYSNLSLGGYQEKESLFSGIPFSQILPYEAFDEEHGIFIGINSLGFVIEAAPLVGGDNTTQKILSSLFTELMNEGSSIQCLLFADHRVEPFLQAWESARNKSKEILKQLAQKRTRHLKQNDKSRIFRFTISYSIHCDEINPSQLQSLKEKKEKFLGVLNSLSLTFAWKPEHLLEYVGGLINFSPLPTLRKRQWNPNQSLASQMTTGEKFPLKRIGLNGKQTKKWLLKATALSTFLFIGQCLICKI